MAFFREITKPFKKTLKHFERTAKNLLEIPRSILSGLTPDVPDPLPIPGPLPPIGIPETGGGEATKRRRLILGGRGKTILAGQLTPTKVGKRRILG